jgi:hypothetical protein
MRRDYEKDEKDETKRNFGLFRDFLLFRHPSSFSFLGMDIAENERHHSVTFRT